MTYKDSLQRLIEIQCQEKVDENIIAINKAIHVLQEKIESEKNEKKWFKENIEEEIEHAKWLAKELDEYVINDFGLKSEITPDVLKEYIKQLRLIIDEKNLEQFDLDDLYESIRREQLKIYKN